MSLSPSHFRDLRRSGLNDQSIKLMGVCSVPPAEIARLSPLLKPCESVLAFPYPGINKFSRYRVFPPIDGLKYWQPPGTASHLYILLSVAEILSNPTIELAITEGEKKAACLTQNGIPSIGVAGIWSWIKPESCELHDEFSPVAFIDRSVIIVFDSDTWTRPEIQKAIYALGKSVEAKGGKVEAIIIPPAADGSKQGADDFIVANSIESFRKLKRIKLRHDGLSQHKPWYEQWRERKQPKAEEARLLLPDPEPWTEPVDGDALMRQVCQTHRRFVDATNAQTVAIALWCLHAHAIDYFDISPFLILTSVNMRSGKTTTIQVIERLVPRPLLASNISVAAFYRVIEALKPTVVLDEFEYIIESIPELRGILNSSHTRRTAYVLRTEGDDFAPRLLSTWAAKCFGLIGKMPATASDRSIEIRMRRKLKSVKKESFKLANDYSDIEVLRRKLLRWVRDNEAAIRTATPPTLDQLDDRANDNWAPLFMIATALGGPWLGYAQTAALEINQIKADDSVSVQLLSDIRAITKGCEKIFSKELLEELLKLEERPWPTYNKGKPISHRQLTTIFKSYEIKTNRTVRIGEDTAKGYETAWFNDVFARYLPADQAEIDSNQSQQSQLNNSSDLDAIFNQSQIESVTDANLALTPRENGVVTAVTDKSQDGAWEEL
jgi:hypothetical protein